MNASVHLGKYAHLAILYVTEGLTLIRLFMHDVFTVTMKLPGHIFGFAPATA